MLAGENVLIFTCDDLKLKLEYRGDQPHRIANWIAFIDRASADWVMAGSGNTLEDAVAMAKDYGVKLVHHIELIMLLRKLGDDLTVQERRAMQKNSSKSLEKAMERHCA